MLAVLFFVFLGVMVLGVPIAMSMGFGAICAFQFGMPRAMITIPTKVFGGLDSFALMAIPFFILAGDIMTASGISNRLIRFADLLVGWVKGGMALATVVACVIFAAICGSASASTSAIGSVMIKAMSDRGYAKGFASCLVASGGTIGPIIPPSLLAVLYAGASGLSVGALFMAGVIPGLVLALSFVMVCILYARKHPEIVQTGNKMTFEEGKRVFFEALPALFMPVIIIGGILFGIMTATESAGVACIYGIVVGFLNRGLTVKSCWNVFAKSAAGVSRLMIIIGIASLFAWILSVRQFPVTVARFLLDFSTNPYVVVLLIILFLIAIGFFMETTAALIILAPILYPIGQQIGFDPLHFAMILFVTLLFGAITPPVGILLFITSSIAGINLSESLRYVGPFVAAFVAVITILIFSPWMTTAIPRMLGLA